MKEMIRTNNGIVRTKGLTSNSDKLHTFASSLVGRMNLSARMGTQSFNGNRDLFQALGYPNDISYPAYEARYRRQDIAKAVIDRPAKATWQGPLLLQESSEANETALEKAWKELDKELGIKTRFSRVDRLSGIGSYGVLLLGLSDAATTEDFKKPVTKSSSLQLMYVKPYGEGSVSILSFEEDASNKRYGLPLMYQINTSDTTMGTSGTTSASAKGITADIHYTRIIHIIDDILENEIIGTPRLEVVFNRLMDLEKVIGGDAEMFWRNARPGYQGKVDPDYSMTPESKQDLKDQIDEYENNLRRMLVTEGVSYEALMQAISDPTNHVDVQLQMISAVTGIPKRILTGTERGELSSAQDASEWRAYVNGRRLDHAEPHIVRPFVDRMIEYGILPKPVSGAYTVEWSDLYSKSEAELVKIGMDRSTALKNYLSSPTAEAVISPEAFLSYFLGLDDNQIEIIKQMKGDGVIAEQLKIINDITKPTTPIADKPNPSARQEKKVKSTKVKQ
jgi:hypothetical protein